MAYCAGDLREHITVYKATDTEVNGFTKREFIPESFTRAARVASVSGKDFATALASGCADVITFTARWIEGLSVADRIEWEGTAYNILEVNLLGARRDYMAIKCRVSPK